MSSGYDSSKPMGISSPDWERQESARESMRRRTEGMYDNTPSAYRGAQDRAILDRGQRSQVGSGMMQNLQGGPGSLFSSLMEQGRLANEPGRRAAGEQLQSLHTRRFSGGGESGHSGASAQQSGNLQAQFAREDALREQAARSQALGFYQQLLGQALGQGRFDVGQAQEGQMFDINAQMGQARDLFNLQEAAANQAQLDQEEYRHNKRRPMREIQDLGGTILGGELFNRLSPALSVVPQGPAPSVVPQGPGGAQQVNPSQRAYAYQQALRQKQQQRELLRRNDMSEDERYYRG